MANYMGFTRTNYFSVTDEEKFRQIIENSYCSEGGIEVFEDDVEGEGDIKFGFGCFGSIFGFRELAEDCGFDVACDESDDEYNYDAFIEALQSVLAQGEAIIITEVGYEKLRYLIGQSHVITKTQGLFVNLRDGALEQARKMLADPGYKTKMDY